MEPAEQGRALRAAAAVEPLGSGRFSANLSSFYTVVGHPHGGYLQCVMASAALAGASEEGATHLHATAVTTNFINATVPGAVELRVEVRRVGRGVSFVYVSMFQDEALVVESLVTLGTLRDDSSIRYQEATMPVIDALEKCRQSTGNEEINIMRVVDLRLDPSCTGWWNGELSNQGEVRGWLRMNDGEASWDAWNLLFAGDALPPATLPLGSSGWVPTLQLTSYVHRVPTSEWLRARQWAVVIADGFLDQRCELFDDTNQLVASSSQLAMVRLPGGH
ncbi:MAG TPA: thioesterase family protein [Acidimicrobiales bacterium]|jgi:acyl-CoA thioesterase|nr:thioesterase family protein [Acidimicrobiales bacterium]